MSMTEKDDSLFTEEEGEILREYAAISPLAIASIVLAALSSLAVIHPLLLAIPVVAAAVATGAIYRISRAGKELSGGKLAMASLALAITCGAWGASGHISTYLAFFGQARKHSDYWLDCIKRGDLYEAYELQVELTQRQDPDTNLKAVYGPISEQLYEELDRFMSEAHENYTLPMKFRAFWSQSPAKEIAMYRDTGKVTFLRNGPQRGFPGFAGVWVDELPVVYRFDYEVDGEKKSFEFAVMMHRHNFEIRREWCVDMCIIPRKS